MSDNPRLNPIIVIAPVPAAAAAAGATQVFLRSDLGGQVLNAPSLLLTNVAIAGTDANNYTTLGVKVGAQAVGLAIGTNPTAGGGSGPVAAYGVAALKVAGQTPAQLALRQWPRGTSTDIATSKADTGTGLAVAVSTMALSVALMQSAYDPLS